MKGRPIRGVKNRRKKRIREYSAKVIGLAMLIIVLIVLCVKKNDTSLVCYKENSNVDYKVYLKENEFYANNYAEKDNQYIASLIDYISADFNYELEIYEEEIAYDYKYRIEAEINVEEKSTGKSLYNFKEQLLEEKSFLDQKVAEVKIKENLKIDYNKYNDLIKKFVSVYELKDAQSSVKINMIININGINGNFARDESDEYIVALEIPLTTKTVAINLNTNLVGCEDDLIVCETKKFCWIKVMIVFAVITEIGFIITLMNYISKSRDPEDIYKFELNKIVTNYGSYIQKINSGFDLNKYEVIELDAFNDMLEIRDTIQEPILMFEISDKSKTYFMIPSKTNILYIYKLMANNESK